MAIVTGDRYLESLVNFVEKQAGPLIEGTLVLKLNPVGLHYVQSRLEYLEELERLLAGAPVDYLRAYVSDLGDHRALEQLRRILRLLTSLKVVSVLSPPSCRDPTPVCLLPFGRLRVLELRGCDLSTSAARGLLELRHTLEKIICHNSTDALRHVFASRIAEIEDSPQWKRLTFVSCAYNGLVLMDDSLRLLPVVETLDLSRNKFAKVDNLWKCVKLKHLDLGFNHLRTIASFSKVSCQITKLVLRNNALTTLHGVENLKSLEGLDLSYNIISNFSELELLAALPSLQSLWLEGNPVCSARWYRAQVYSFFPVPDKLILDDETISTRDVWKRHIILTSRHKQPASFGFYSPAKDNAEIDGSINAKRKKLSRIASIETETSTSDDESVTFVDEALENADSNERPEIVDFIEKIESMKTERSSLWLEEFKQWVDHASEDSVKRAVPTGLAFISGKESDLKKKRRQKHFGETSGYASNSLDVSGDENGAKLPESHNLLNGSFINTESEQYSYGVSETTSKYLLGHTDKDVSVPDHMSYYYRGHDPIGNPKAHTDSLLPGVKGILSSSTIDFQGIEVLHSKKSFMPLDTIDDIIDARSTSGCASPPHYQEHILHRRHDLEEELLQLSAESFSVASSDSYSSDSSYEPVEVGSHMHNESTTDEVSKSVDSPTFLRSSEDSFFDRRPDMSQLTENGTHMSSSCTESTSNKERMDSTAFQQSCSSYQASPYHGERVDLVKQEANWLEKKKCKRKPKKRVVSLRDDTISLTDGTDTDDMMESLCMSNCSSHVNQSKAYRKIVDMNGGSQILTYEVHITDVGGEIHHWAKSSEEYILSYFNANLGDFGVQETCEQCIRCYCMLEEASGCNESEVVLLSSEHMLYILLCNGQQGGSGSRPCLVGSLGAEDVKEVLVGLGLQAVRVYTKRGKRYLFITRSVEKSRQLISILEFFPSHAKKNRFPLTSLDQIQVALFEKYICGGSRTNILQYSMVLFWKNSMEEKLWVSRSLFVLGGQILVCMEDISQFGFDSQDTYSPYFSIDSCCAVVDALEMVTEGDADWCVILTLKNDTSVYSSELKKKSKKGPGKAVTWKLKWLCKETQSNFVALVKALHAGTSTSSLIVRSSS